MKDSDSLSTLGRQISSSSCDSKQSMYWQMANGLLLKVAVQLGCHGAIWGGTTSLKVVFKGRRRASGKGNACRECMATKLELRCWGIARYAQ